ncbi:MAG: hypothetical protein ACXVXL_30010 [Solirubrobacteraceae bacterium]
MSIRDVEADASPLLTIHKTLDEIRLTQADIYRKLDALKAVLLGEGDDAEHAAVLTDDTRARLAYEAEARIQRMSPAALEKFIAERDAAKRREPFYSTDRSPRVLREGGIAVYDEHGQPILKPRPGGPT